MGQTFLNRLRYEEWVRAYAPELYRYAYRLTGNPQVAEDILQETFMEAWRCVDKQSEPGKARAWLFQILRYRHAHYRRDNRRQRQVTPLADSGDDHPADSTRPHLDTLADRDALQTALNSLSDPIRLTFVTVFVEGRTCRQAAQALHIPLGTVLSRLDSARRSLRAAMEDSRPFPTITSAVKPADSRNL
jgi:RNA polymerase sigma-70 factor (ECF subfamily)